MKEKCLRLGRLGAVIIGILTLTIACGGKVQGNTYVDNGGVVQIEFKSGGKAYVSLGPTTNTCSYTETDKSVTLICENDKTVFTIDEDAALNGPPGGMITRLT